MYAAIQGSLACVKLLLPPSAASDEDKKGRTPSDHARATGFYQLAAFIDAYVLALSDGQEISDFVGPGVAQKSQTLRV